MRRGITLPVMVSTNLAYGDSDISAMSLRVSGKQSTRECVMAFNCVMVHILPRLVFFAEFRNMSIKQCAKRRVNKPCDIRLTFDITSHHVVLDKCDITDQHDNTIRIVDTVDGTDRFHVTIVTVAREGEVCAYIEKNVLRQQAIGTSLHYFFFCAPVVYIFSLTAKAVWHHEE